MLLLGRLLSAGILCKGWVGMAIEGPFNVGQYPPIITDRELFLEVREDVKDLRLSVVRIESKLEIYGDHEGRLRLLERTGFKVQGAWASIGLLAALVAGIAGLAIGVLSIYPFSS